MKTLMLFLVSIGTALLMNACTSITPNVATGLKKACLPEAMIMHSALERQNIDAKVLSMRYTSGSHVIGHAVSLFCYENQLMAWDSTWGSIAIGPMKSYKEKAPKLGMMYLEKRYGSSYASLRGASFAVDSASR